MTTRSTRFKDAIAALDAGIAQHATPGAQLSIRWREGDAWHGEDTARGRLSYEESAPLVTVDTVYDYASVTKALVALAGARLLERKGIAWNTTLGEVLPAMRGLDAEGVTLEQLASHRSELPAWYPFYQSVLPREVERGGTRERVLADVRATTREPNGSVARYSDVGYILFGEALEAIAGRTLIAVVSREVSEPLGLDAIVEYRGVSEASRDARIAPTEWCAWRGRVMQGIVHDENCFALEGRAGHAGLFGTASALATVGRASLDALAGDDGWFSPATMRAMTAPREGGSHRLGWDGKSGANSSAGTKMSNATFGHLGFTGTSLWCDPEAGVAIALVTNRVHPTRENGTIRGLRIAVHDAVMKALRG